QLAATGEALDDQVRAVHGAAFLHHFLAGIEGPLQRQRGRQGQPFFGGERAKLGQPTGQLLQSAIDRHGLHAVSASRGNWHSPYAAVASWRNRENRNPAVGLCLRTWGCARNAASGCPGGRLRGYNNKVQTRGSR